MKKILIITLTACLMTVGVTYGYWTDHIYINATAQTGKLEMVIGDTANIEMKLGRMGQEHWSEDTSSQYVLLNAATSNHTENIYQVAEQEKEQLSMDICVSEDELQGNGVNAIQISYTMVQGKDGTVNLFETYQKEAEPVVMELQSGSFITAEGEQILDDKELEEILSEIDCKRNYKLQGEVKVESQENCHTDENNLMITKSYHIPEHNEGYEDDGDRANAQTLQLVYTFHSSTIIGQKVPSLCLYTYCLWSQMVPEKGTVTINLDYPSRENGEK